MVGTGIAFALTPLVQEVGVLAACAFSSVVQTRLTIVRALVTPLATTVVAFTALDLFFIRQASEARSVLATQTSALTIDVVEAISTLVALPPLGALVAHPAT